MKSTLRTILYIVLMVCSKTFLYGQVLQESNEKINNLTQQIAAPVLAPELKTTSLQVSPTNEVYRNYVVKQALEVVQNNRRVDSIQNEYDRNLYDLRRKIDSLKILQTSANAATKPYINSLLSRITQDTIKINEQKTKIDEYEKLKKIRENEKTIALLLSEYVPKDSSYRRKISDFNKTVSDVNNTILNDTILVNKSQEAKDIKNFYKQNVIFFQQTTGLLKDIEIISAAVNKLEKKLDSTKALASNPDQIIAASIEVDLLKKSLKIEDALRDFTTKYNAFKKDYDALVIQKQALGAKDQNDDLAVIPTLVSQLGQGAVTPNITLLGNTNFGAAETGFYGDIRVFTAPVSTNQSATLRNFFVPEASSFGFLSNFGFSFVPIKKGREENRLGVFAAINYLGKSIPDASNTKSISQNVLHTKLGIQAIVIPGVVSFYYSGNFLFVTDNSADFAINYPNQTGRSRVFSDLGFKFFIRPAKASQLNLLIDLGFIRINEDIRDIFTNTSFATTTDSVIPVLKIGIKKNFGF